MTQKIKSVRAVVKHVTRQKKVRWSIIFRAVVTLLEVVAAVYTYKQTGDLATAAGVGTLLSIIVNILKESGLLEFLEAEEAEVHDQ